MQSEIQKCRGEIPIGFMWNTSKIYTQARSALQRDFQEYNGEIPMGFLQVEYELLRKDLHAIMGREPDEAPAAQSLAEAYPDR